MSGHIDTLVERLAKWQGIFIWLELNENFLIKKKAFKKLVRKGKKL